MLRTIKFRTSFGRVDRPHVASCTRTPDICHDDVKASSAAADYFALAEFEIWFNPGSGLNRVVNPFGTKTPRAREFGADRGDRARTDPPGGLASARLT